MLNKLIKTVRKRPFLFILIGLLAVISVISIKPGYYLMGWDNYSSFFNQKTNLWRWFFHSWREFRGLGVPSDSEITELPRQLFFFILSPLVPETLLEQLYFLFSFSLGGILMYVLFTKIVQNYKNIKQYQDIGGFVTAFLYLYNLNTLSVFFFPITPYVTRFFAIPLLILAFHTAVTSKKISWKQFIFLISAVFIAAPSYVIGTVFITISLALGIFILFQHNIKKGLLIGIIFGLLNAFWLFPFLNYTIQKSDILPLAPTFISANETQLNKPASFYALDKQLMLVPNFFETTVTSIGLDKTTYLHPLANIYSSFPTYALLLIFPVLYILGSFLIIVRFKTYRRLLWIPSIIFVFLFLSLKDYSPIGFVYHFFSEYIPFFDVIFRFGDTKFHPFIAFAGSLAGGFVVTYFLSLVAQYKKMAVTYIAYGAVILIVIVSAIPFRYFLTDSLLGSFMYNKLPNEYREIAKIINEDPSQFRVLHLPYDDEVYWRSYSWGYVGSSFLHYLLDKPLFEKTFEPASMENAYVMEKIQTLLHNSQSLQDEELNQRSVQLYDLLTELGIKYVILDGTVSRAQPTRGMMLWGSFNYPEARTILETLRMNDYAQPVFEGELKLYEYMDAYKKMFPVSDDVTKRIQNADPEPIVLYKLKDAAPKVQFLSQATPIDPELEQELLVKEYIDADHTVGQAENATIYPFLRNNTHLTKKGAGLSMLYDPSQAGTYEINTSDNSINRTFLIELTGQIQNEFVVITPYLHYLPTINETVFRSKLKPIIVPVEIVQKSLQDTTDKRTFLASWDNVPQDALTDLRVQINDTILPIPVLDSREQTLGYSIVDTQNIQINILARDRVTEFNTDTIRLTESPNCFNDAIEEYNFSVKSSENAVTIESQNGTTCFWQDLQSIYDDETVHLEINISLHGQSENLDTIFKAKPFQSSKPNIAKFITDLQKPNILQVCIKEHNVDSCYNTYQLLNIPESTKKIRIPTTENVDNIEDLLVFFALKNTQYQKQELSIDSFSVYSYKPVAEEAYAVEVPKQITEKIDIEETIEITIPFTISPRSYAFDKEIDMLSISNDPCRQSNAYRTFRRLDGAIVSYVQNCQNQMFTEIPFSSDGFYLWSVNYNLASGKYPQFILDDEFYTYKNEYMSVYNGYPKIKAFKKYQEPEHVFHTYDTETFNALSFENTYTYIYPHPEYHDKKIKQFMIQQFSENEGIVMIDDFKVIELPNYWSTLKMKPQQELKQFAVPEKIAFESLLPSLKRITIEENSSQRDALLKFNEGYDAQWGVYSSITSAVFGQKITSNHTRCDGYANCFYLPKQYAQQGTVMYLFYWPEVLNFLGWIISGGVIFGLFVLRKKNE